VLISKEEGRADEEGDLQSDPFFSNFLSRFED
jgi:hypothetical protein